MILGLARAALVLFAATLLLAAFLKGRQPEPAAFALAWTGLDLELRMILVTAVTVAEAILGSLVLSGLYDRRLLLVSSGVAFALLAGHAAGMLLGDGRPCGCFGDVGVPDELVLALCAIGLPAGLVVVRQDNRRLAMKRVGATAVLAAVALSPFWSRPVRPAESPARRLLRAIPESQRAAEEIFLIGSWSCKHCRESIEEIGLARSTDLALAGIVLHFVTRAGDVRPPSSRMDLPWLRPHTIPAELWWASLIDAPPTFLRVDGQGRWRLDRSWR